MERTLDREERARHAMAAEAMLTHVRVVLVNTRFPENVGMAARACANFGVRELSLVTPERWNREKANPLATPKGQGVLDALAVKDGLLEAIQDAHLTIAATARTGGWRRHVLSPWEAARLVAEAGRSDRKAALVFGSEDRGLENAHIELCQHVVTIPTAEASSLNLAQSVLLLLYECLKEARLASRRGREGAGQPDEPPQEPCGEASGAEARGVEADMPDLAQGGRGSRQRTPLSTGDFERLMENWQDALLRLDVLHGDNPAWFLMPWRKLFTRADLRKHEYEALMGLCRQIRSRVPHKPQKGS